MLAPGQELNSRYLRTLRQTLTQIILPELTTPAGRNAVTLCEYVLLRMTAAMEALPGIHAAHRPALEALARANLLKDCDPRDCDTVPIHLLARSLQDTVPGLFEQAADGGSFRRLAEIGSEAASFRRDYEAAYKLADAAVEALPATLQISPAAVQAHLDARFPRQGIRLRSCHQIPGGRSKLTLLLSVEPNPVLPEQMVIRVDGPDSPIGTTVQDEFPILDVMYKAGIAAPEPLWVEADARYIGAAFMVMRRMAGQAAGDLWGAQDVSPAIGRALAEALAAVHQADLRAIWPGASADAREAVKRMLHDFEQSWRAGDSTPSLAMECAYGWLRGQLDCIDGASVAVHGDAHFANLLVENDALVCLLDWEFCHAGHPADDLAYCRPYVEKIMPWEAFLSHYRRHGGRVVTEAQLGFFGIWSYLRNATYAANMLRDFCAGKVHGIQSLAIALNTRAKLEALLAEAMAAALRRAAAETVS